MTFRRQSIGILAAVCIAWLVVLVGGTYVLGKGLKNAREELGVVQKRINEIVKKREQFEWASSEYKNAQGDLSRVRAAFIDDSNLLSVLMSLENEARRTVNNYEVRVEREVSSKQTSQKGAAPSSGALPGMIFTMELRGTAAGIYDFISAVQGIPYFIQWQRVSIQRQIKGGEGDGAPLPLKAILALKVYAPSP